MTATPVKDWRTHYTGPLPVSLGQQCALTCVDTVTGLLQAFSCKGTNQTATIKGVEQLSVTYGYPVPIDSNQGMHFTGHLSSSGHMEKIQIGDFTHHIIPSGRVD